MRSTIAAGTASATTAGVAGVEKLRSHPHWQQPRVDVAPVTPIHVHALAEDDLAPARGIGLALIAGALLWVGLGWGLVELVARFS